VIKTNYKKANFDYWQSEYQTDYPDTSLVKLYHHILKHDSNFKKSKTLKMLDFGCNNGKNALFFHTLNFDVYGVDINQIGINKANDRIKDLGMKNHFLSIDPELPEDTIFFGGNFDLIISWYTLYYLSNTDLRKCLNILYKNLKPGGYFVASMSGTQTANFAITSEVGDGLYEMPIIERLKDLHGQSHFINFTHGEEDLLEKFNLFKVCHVGYLDECYSWLNNKNNLFHYIFVGVKE